MPIRIWAALLSKSLRNLEHQNFGFQMNDRYIAWINPTLGREKPEQMESLFRQIDHRLLQIPGVRMVAPALYAPMTGDSWNNGIRIEGRPEREAGVVREDLLQAADEEQRAREEHEGHRYLGDHKRAPKAELLAASGESTAAGACRKPRYRFADPRLFRAPVPDSYMEADC